MRLTPGTRLGPFEVVTSIGAGGMGEVYRARDTRLDRDVAIKLLPAEFVVNKAFDPKHADPRWRDLLQRLHFED